MHIVCPHCLTINNIPEQKNHTLAKCGKCNESVYSATPIVLDNNNFYRFIERNHLPVIVDFWASWCGPCRAMAPVFEAVSRQSDSILFAKINTESAQQVSGEAGIRSIPTLIFFHHGKEIDRISGGMSEPQLKQWIMQCLQKLN